MSRIGRQIIKIPNGVIVTTTPTGVTVKGPKGEMSREVPGIVSVLVVDGTVAVDVVNKENINERSLWGTYASHIKNMIVGVVDGFKKQLEINGVGYRVAMQGRDLKLDVGFSHPVIYKIADDVVATVEKNLITLESANKESVGQAAAEIRAIKKPEPYKGKGIKYIDEVIRRKAGKAAKSA
jgi:large subunit ribosomal protein L6